MGGAGWLIFYFLINNKKQLSVMAHSSPLHNKKRTNFAETDPKIRAELRKQEMHLKREIERLEKQTKATNSYISDHQQALKMSWRRLEEQRQKDESPTVSRRTRRSDGLINDSKRKLLFSNATSVTIDLPNPNGESSHPRNSKGLNDDLSSSGSVPFIEPGGSPLKMRGQSQYNFAASPYISSPQKFRRQAPTTVSGLGRSQAPQHPLTMASGVTGRKSLTSVGSEDDIDECSASSSSVVVPATSKTTNKTALLKASMAMKLDSSSYDPMAFKQFYNLQATDSSAALLDTLIMTEEEEEMFKELTKDEQEELEKAKKEVCKACTASYTYLCPYAT